MKKALIINAICLFFGSVATHAQTANQPDTALRSIDLGEVVVKSTEPDKFSNRIHSDNVFIVLNPTQAGVSEAKMDSTYFVTRFPQPENSPIFLSAVELKLKPYDPAMFDVKLIIFQIHGNDTMRKVLPIDAAKIDRKGKLRVLLFDENITLQPGEFFIGFGFHTKSITEQFHYRMYSTNKGEGAMLTFRKDGVNIVSNPHFPYVFPFKMSYRKL